MTFNPFFSILQLSKYAYSCSFASEFNPIADPEKIVQQLKFSQSSLLLGELLKESLFIELLFNFCIFEQRELQHVFHQIPLHTIVF